MRIKPDWLPLLHAARAREIELVFGRVPDKAFRNVLELGAGDGFQSQLLARYAQSLIATDLNPHLLPKENRPGIEYRVCDAEAVGDLFDAGRYDLIFSSNLLEHLPDVQRALRGMHHVLGDAGIAIHLMPSPIWKLSHLLCFPVDLIARNVDALLSADRRGERIRRLGAILSPRPGVSSLQPELGNNIKLQRAPRGRLSRLLIAEPHGVSSTNFAEFEAFSRARWTKEFTLAGFEVTAVLKGPVTSGYGFGLERIRRLAERLGLASEHIYITVKCGYQSAALRWFTNTVVARDQAATGSAEAAA